MDEGGGDLFAGLGWRAEIINLADPHIPFNPSPKGGLSGTKRFWNDYEMTLLLQSTQEWKWRIEQEDRVGGKRVVCRMG